MFSIIFYFLEWKNNLATSRPPRGRPSQCWISQMNFLFFHAVDVRVNKDNGSGNKNDLETMLCVIIISFTYWKTCSSLENLLKDVFGFSQLQLGCIELQSAKKMLPHPRLFCLSIPLALVQCWHGLCCGSPPRISNIERWRIGKGNKKWTLNNILYTHILVVDYLHDIRQL